MDGCTFQPNISDRAAKKTGARLAKKTGAGRGKSRSPPNQGTAAAAGRSLRPQPNAAHAEPALAGAGHLGGGASAALQFLQRQHDTRGDIQQIPATPPHRGFGGYGGMPATPNDVDSPRIKETVAAGIEAALARESYRQGSMQADAPFPNQPMRPPPPIPAGAVHATQQDESPGGAAGADIYVPPPPPQTKTSQQVRFTRKGLPAVLPSSSPCLSPTTSCLIAPTIPEISI